MKVCRAAKRGRRKRVTSTAVKPVTVVSGKCNGRPGHQIEDGETKKLKNNQNSGGSHEQRPTKAVKHGERVKGEDRWRENQTG